MKDELSRYYRLLKKYLVCSKSDRERFVSQTRKKTEEFLNENPDAGFKDVEAFLGDPKTLAETFMEMLDPAELKRHKRNRRIRKMVLTALPVVVIIFLCILIYYITQMQADIEITKEVVTTIYD